MEEMFMGKKRNPGLVILYAFLTLGIYNLVWYYKINNEVQKHDSSQDLSPGMAVCAMFVPIFNLVSLYNTANRIKLMQKADGSTDLIGPGVALLWAMFFGIGYPIYVQSALNNHWHEHVVSDAAQEEEIARLVLEEELVGECTDGPEENGLATNNDAEKN